MAVKDDKKIFHLPIIVLWDNDECVPSPLSVKDDISRSVHWEVSSFPSRASSSSFKDKLLASCWSSEYPVYPKFLP